MKTGVKIVAGTTSALLAQAVATNLKAELVPVEIHPFPNSETHVQLAGPIPQKTVYLFASTGPPTNTHLMELLLLADASLRAGASRVIAVVPYLGYGRQDRVSRPGEPVSAHLVAKLLKAAGITEVVVIDPHSPAFAEFCALEQLPVTELTAIPLLTAKIINHGFHAPRIVSPDQGGIARAEAFAHLVTPGQPPLVIPKKRLDHETVTMEEIIGEVGREVIIVDDVLSTGGTIAEAARLSARAGAKEIWVAVTHGEFVGPARARLESAPIDGIFVTDSLPLPPRSRRPTHLTRVSLVPLISQEIQRREFQAY